MSIEKRIHQLEKRLRPVQVDLGELWECLIEMERTLPLSCYQKADTFTKAEKIFSKRHDVTKKKFIAFTKKAVLENAGWRQL